MLETVLLRHFDILQLVSPIRFATASCLSVRTSLVKKCHGTAPRQDQRHRSTNASKRCWGKTVCGGTQRRETVRASVAVITSVGDKPVHDSTQRSPGSELARSVFPRMTRQRVPVSHVSLIVSDPLATGYPLLQFILYDHTELLRGTTAILGIYDIVLHAWRKCR